ncbi:MAG: DUF302 domain-containing protein [Pseudomonadota bacterium]
MRAFPVALVIAAATFAGAPSTAAQSVVPERDGWRIVETSKDYKTLLSDLKEAVTANKMGLVTEAGPTEVAAERGETIPGNRVVGVFRNDFAVDIIRAAPAAMIHAPIRIMVMEEPGGTATLAYKTPSAVLAPYVDEGGAVVENASTALDEVFDQITQQAAQ